MVTMVPGACGTMDLSSLFTLGFRWIQKVSSKVCEKSSDKILNLKPGSTES